MASTDIDQFRSFVFDSSFLKTYEVDEKTIEKIRTDDIELLLFSYKLLASMLFGTNDIRVKSEVLQAKVDAIRKDQEQDGKSLEERAEADYKVIKEEWNRAKAAR